MLVVDMQIRTITKGADLFIVSASKTSRRILSPLRGFRTLCADFPGQRPLRRTRPGLFSCAPSGSLMSCRYSRLVLLSEGSPGLKPEIVFDSIQGLPPLNLQALTGAG